MTVKQAAARVGVSPSLIDAWIAEGRLPHSRFGRTGRRGKIVIKESAVEKLIPECRAETKPATEPLVLKHILVR